MCSVSFFKFQGETLLAMNRDEKKARARSPGLKVYEEGNVKIIRPEDGLAHGSWIAANNRGHIFCLLNNYRSQNSDIVYTSRGFLVAELIKKSNLDDILQVMNKDSLKKFQGFKLLCLTPKRATLFVWDTEIMQQIEIIEDVFFISSSSFREVEVVQRRQAVFDIACARLKVARDMAAARAVLRELHSWKSPQDNAYGVCMNRPDAQTQSYSEILSDAVRLSFDHYDLPLNFDLGYDIFKGEKSHCEVVLC